MTDIEAPCCTDTHGNPVPCQHSPLDQTPEARLDDRLLLTDDEVREYGFAWGPMQVIRLGHPHGSGYYVRVLTEYGVVNVYVSEKGHKMRAFQRDFTKAERKAAREATDD